MGNRGVCTLVSGVLVLVCLAGSGALAGQTEANPDSSVEATTGPAGSLLPVSEEAAKIKPLTADDVRELTSPPETAVLRPVTLGDVISLTLERNLDYRIDQINLEVARDEVTSQKGIFDPLLSLSVEQQEVTAQGSIFSSLRQGAGGLTGLRQASSMQAPREEPVADVRRQQQDPNQDIQELLDALREIEDALSQGFQSDYRDVTSLKSKTGSAEVTERLPWGGSVGMGYSINRNWQDPSFLNINPSYSQNLSVFGVHPLPFFRNWGKTVTYSSIHLAMKNERSRDWAVYQQLMDQMAAVSKGYWNLISACHNAQVALLSLRTAENLLRINQVRLENEVGTEIDVAEARAGVALRENSLIQAAQAIGLAQDNLARLTRVNEGHDWKVRMIPKVMPHYEPYGVDEEAFIAEAMAKRPEVQQARLSKARAEIREEVARNQRMPRFDIFGEYGLSGLGPTASKAGSSLRTQDYDGWRFGLDFSVPIPNRKARYRYKQAKRLVDGTDLVIEQVQDLVIFEVRDGIRKLQTARDSIAASQVRVEAEKKKFNGEIKRYEVGMATSQDLLDYQEDLALAVSSLITAMADYNKAVYDIERARGTLLDYLKLEVPAPERVSAE